MSKRAGEFVTLDELVDGFRNRPLDRGPYTFCWIDALTQKVREGGRTVNVHGLIATGVNAGGCGTPIASLANLIGARLYLTGRSSRRRFWRLFAAVSAALLLAAIALSLALVKYSGGSR